jgi:hypothetical protein
MFPVVVMGLFARVIAYGESGKHLNLIPSASFVPSCFPSGHSLFSLFRNSGMGNERHRLQVDIAIRGKDLLITIWFIENV